MVTLLIASSLVTVVIKALGLMVLLSVNGPINKGLMVLGMIDHPIRLLNNDVGVTLGLVHYTLPLVVLVLFSVVQTIPESLEEAASSLGAGPWRAMYRVVLPLAMPGLVAAGLMAFNLAMGTFTSTALLGGGKVLTLPILIERKAILEVNYPVAATISMMLLLAGILVMLSLSPFPADAAGHASGGHGMTLRWLIIGALLFGYAFLLAPLVLVMIASFAGGQSTYVVFPPTSFSFEWYFRLPSQYFWPAVISVAVAFVAGTISSVLGILAAFGLVRGKIPGRTLLRAYFNAPMQIPFVVTGIVFLQFYYLLYGVFGLRLVGNFWGLLGVHVFITLPYVIGTVGAVLERFEPSVEEAALTLGASPWSTFRRVTLPLIKPGVLAGSLYAFVVSFGDIPATMFVTSTSTTTLPVQLFHAIEFDYSPALLALCSLVVVLSMSLIFAIQWLLGFDFVMRGRAGG